jgi:hypothetical protein
VANAVVPDVSVVVVAGADAKALHGCITSVQRAVRLARQHDWSAELIILLQQSTPAIRNWVQQMLAPEWQVCSCEETGRGSARNEAMRSSAGRHMALIDGSDLWSENWLLASLREAAQRSEPTVWHPEALITFGADQFSIDGYSICFQQDATSFEDYEAAMLGSNLYPAGYLAHRAILESQPHPVEDPTRGWGHADWWWQCNVVAAGYAHHIVAETFHYRRLPLGAELFTAKDDPSRIRVGPTRLAIDSPLSSDDAQQISGESLSKSNRWMERRRGKEGRLQ